MQGSPNARMRAVTLERTSQRFTPVGAPKTNSGPVTLISGCMFSGKTTELLRRVASYDRAKVAAFKHAVDVRYSRNEIVSHAGKAYPACAVTSAGEILSRLAPGLELVAIDEAHFLDVDLVDVTGILARRGLAVVLTSLDPDSWGRPFEVLERLRPIAGESVFLQATCARCDAVASRTQRLTPIVGGNMADGPENYEPRCPACWTPPPERAPSLWAKVGV
ncbi:MAG: thymidine kinase [Planctomycetes bacterium]|nr:thymidine kinase [Planctomycetota bacterium]